jgi:sugar transferase (PEP-CTERM system associated)
MIRFLNAYFPARTLFLGISEVCLIALSFTAAAIVRLGTYDAAVMLNYEQGFLKIVALSGILMFCMYYFDLYNTSILSNQREILSRLVQALGTMCIGLAVLYYLYPPLELGRGIIFVGLCFVLVVLVLWRVLFLTLNQKSRFTERTVIFGDGPSAIAISRELELRPELGIKVVGKLSTECNGKYELSSEQRSPFSTTDASTTSDLWSAIGQQRVSRIIVALDERRGKLPVDLLLAMKNRGVRIQDGTEVYEQVTGKVPIESLRLGTLLFSSGFQLSRFLVAYKRFASIVVSVFGLVVTLPLLPFIALAIKLSSPGNLLYHQKRIGKDGVVFYCHKFRTMRADAEADTGPTWAGDEDPRITSVGRLLRITRADEIPQLWNVLKGDMSLVGPRPERPEFIEQLKQAIPFYDLRHTVRPGITGWAQIRYRYGNCVEDAKEKLRYDLFYIKNMSPGLDALIVFETAKTILLGRGAR